MEVLDGPFKLFLSTFTENITHTLLLSNINKLLLIWINKNENRIKKKRLYYQ